MRIAIVCKFHPSFFMYMSQSAVVVEITKSSRFSCPLIYQSLHLVKRVCTLVNLIEGYCHPQLKELIDSQKMKQITSETIVSMFC